jgi:hypothetical protein
MSGLLSFLALACQASPVSLTFRDGAFLVGGSGNVSVVPVRQAPSETPGLDRKNQRWTSRVADSVLTFDTSGLTIVRGGQRSVTRLSSVPTSGKVATKESNEALLKLVADGVRRLEVSAMSGVEILESKVYLLARWEDKDGQTWLEALMVIDLAEPRPLARLIDRLPGGSFAAGVVDDVLASQDGELWALYKKGSQFGMARFKLDQPGPPATVMFGPVVERARISPTGRFVWAHSSTRHGTVVIGFVDMESDGYIEGAEVRGRVAGFFEPAVAKVRTSAGTILVNLATGAQWQAPSDCAVRQTPAGLLVWAPPSGPKRAALHDPHGRILATWVQAAPAQARGG